MKYCEFCRMQLKDVLVKCKSCNQILYKGHSSGCRDNSNRQNHVGHDIVDENVDAY